MEASLMLKMQNRLAIWANFQPSLKGRTLLFNVFISSKLWFYVRNFPISAQFASQIKFMLNSWLWRSKTPPIPTALLANHTTMGGLSLLDPVAHAQRMFSIWLSTVLDPTMCSPSWQFAARIQWSKSLNLNNYKLNTTLFNHLSRNPNLYGPQTLSGFWRTVTAYFRHSNLLIIKGC